MRHAPPDLKADIRSLMESLDEHKIYRIEKGQILGEDEVVKDVITIGLQNLTAGQKSPLSEYNIAFRRLQKRRKMKPVSASALESMTPPLHDTLPTPHLLPIPRAASQTPMPQIPPSEDDELEEIEEEPKGEAAQILEDVANGVVEKTLPRLSPEDVELDMNEVVVEDDEVVESEDDEEGEEDADLSWVDGEPGK
ncbi:hypothetical protein CVT26_003094 [Gymnopilus dilepis]|uniref:Uncharacterized protein n=1 Tax=Gymnopilus dilepis TaxID=231916 RepID=A0A409Y4W4_9AGAR|nr:hypothetical protein CVT26_003094 [Gymnopilus dilepis]